MPAHTSAGNMNERGRERTVAGLGTVGRRWAGPGGKGEGACLLTLARVLKERWGGGGGGGAGGGLVSLL